MRTRYITTDLDLEAPCDLAAIQNEFSDDVLPHFCGPIGERFRASFGLYSLGSESGDIEFFCALIESLSDESKDILAKCSKVDFNMGYEAGSEPKSWRTTLPGQTLERVASVGGDIIVTIYPVGTYT